MADGTDCPNPWFKIPLLTEVITLIRTDELATSCSFFRFFIDEKAGVSILKLGEQLVYEAGFYYYETGEA